MEITDENKYVIFLDIEFQNFNIKSKQYHYILEMGIIIFEEGKEMPILIEHVNFPLHDFPNMRLLGIEYSTVSEKTEENIPSPVMAQEEEEEEELIPSLPSEKIEENGPSPIIIEKEEDKEKKNSTTKTIEESEEKQKVLDLYCQENGYQTIWFTQKTDSKFYRKACIEFDNTVRNNTL